MRKPFLKLQESFSFISSDQVIERLSQQREQKKSPRLAASLFLKTSLEILVQGTIQSLEFPFILLSEPVLKKCLSCLRRKNISIQPRAPDKREQPFTYTILEMSPHFAELGWSFFSQQQQSNFLVKGFWYCPASQGV
ncbi:MAG: hypothetical protein ABIN58_00920 [candidate division WOR-3 bacterium]